MKRSTDRILTTHTGSLPRHVGLVELYREKEEGRPVDPRAFESSVHDAVKQAVDKQVEAAIDVINDGEQGKASYALYVKDRLAGFEEEKGPTVRRLSAETKDFPEYYDRLWALRSFVRRPVCTGPVSWKDRGAVRKDIDTLKASLEGVEPEEVFMTAASPGVVSLFMADRYYGSEEKYVHALAEVLKEEYDEVHGAGFLLQVDCPDLAFSRTNKYVELTGEEFLKVAEMHVEALNEALRDIPPDRMRLHVCWGNGEGPHHRNIPLRQIIDVLLKARPAGLSVEGANPRHEHEWKVFQDVKLPDGKVLIPGVLDSTTNFIEHPEVVEQRIVRYAETVGRENVIAGTDCGFGTIATFTPQVDPKIAWAKLRSLGEGAQLASAVLW